MCFYEELVLVSAFLKVFYKSKPLGSRRVSTAPIRRPDARSRPVEITNTLSSIFSYVVREIIFLA